MTTAEGSLTLPYQAFTFSEEDDAYETDDAVLAPALDIVVHGPKRPLPLQGIVDSGADCTLFSYEVMASLGISESECEETGCITAGGPGTRHVFKDGLEIEFPDLNRRLRVEAGFADGIPGSIALLGRLDFFANYLVTIDQQTKTFTLRPHEPQL